MEGEGGFQHHLSSEVSGIDRLSQQHSGSPLSWACRSVSGLCLTGAGEWTMSSSDQARVRYIGSPAYHDKFTLHQHSRSKGGREEKGNRTTAHIHMPSPEVRCMGQATGLLPLMHMTSK